MADLALARQVSQIIGLVYDCALDSRRWPDVIDSLRQNLDFTNAVLGVNSLPSGEITVHAVSGVPFDWLSRMTEYADDIIALWGGAERIQQYPLCEPIIQSQALGPVHMLDNRYFREWAQPQGIIDAVAIGFARDASMVGTLAFGRHHTAGEIGDQELEVLRMIAPHMQRAISISRLLDHQTVQAETFAGALDAFMAGVILVGPSLEILYANTAAKDLLARQGPLSTRSGSLCLQDASASIQLQAAVQRAEQDEASLGRQGIAIPALSRRGDPAVIHVLPLKTGNTRSNLMRQASAALFISPAQMQRVPIDALAMIYELTPAEARILELLAEGHTSADVGKMLGIKPSTVKTHVLRIFAKTRCNRQIDLSNLVRSFRQSG